MIFIISAIITHAGINVYQSFDPRKRRLPLSGWIRSFILYCRLRCHFARKVDQICPNGKIQEILLYFGTNLNHFMVKLTTLHLPDLTVDVNVRLDYLEIAHFRQYDLAYKINTSKSD